MDNWIEQSLGNLIVEEKKSTIQVQSASNFGDYPFFTSGDNVLVHNEYLVDGEKLFLATGGKANIKFYNGKAAYSTDTYVISSEKASTQYLYYFLQNQIEFLNSNLFTGSGLKHLQKNDLRRLRFKLPESKSEQTRIAQILSTADRAIAQTEALIAKYQRIKTGLMQDLLTRGIDEHGRIRSKATHRFVVKNGIEVPEEWEVRELDEVANIIVSNVDKKTIEGEIKVILCNYMDVYCNTVISKSLQFMEASATAAEIKRFTLNIGDVVITKDSETPDDIAVPSVVKDEIPRLICGYHLAIIRPKSNINGYYLMFQFLKHNAKLHFGSHATGSTRFGLSINSIKKFKIAIPDIKEQLNIEEKINSIEHLLQKETIYFSKLQSLKTGLMQDLLSGRVRVKVPETGHEKEQQNA